jgi:hypothetical protein
MNWPVSGSKSTDYDDSSVGCGDLSRTKERAGGKIAHALATPGDDRPMDETSSFDTLGEMP